MRGNDENRMMRPLSDPRDATICVVGTVRNGGKTLARDIERLSATTQAFASRRFFIVESDSSDNTVAELETLRQTRADFAFESCGKLANQMPLRTQRISFCRNRCVDFVKGLPDEATDFILVADLDGINSRISAASLLSCWQLPVPWDVCTGNRVGRYYDIFALRCAGWVEEDCFREAKALSATLDPNLARYLTTEAKMIKIPKDHRPIKVESAFGGIGLYRSNVYRQGRYDGLDEIGAETCEHVAFHRMLGECGAEIYINPSMIAGGIKEFPGKNLLRLLK
jgi:glycosyltransferase involved in cell wall biosynthesis